MDAKLPDLGTTIAGGGTGLTLLATVRWEAMPYGLGEPLKLLVALSLISAGYRMYRNKKSE